MIYQYTYFLDSHEKESYVYLCESRGNWTYVRPFFIILLLIISIFFTFYLSNLRQNLAINILIKINMAENEAKLRYSR